MASSTPLSPFQETEQSEKRMVERVCEEGHSCEVVGSRAEFFCKECGTHQCSKCESVLHGTRELKLHSRERLSIDGRWKPCELWCDPKNAATVRCRQCGVETCRDCDTRMHQGKRKSHVRLQTTSRGLAEMDRTTAGMGKDMVRQLSAFLHLYAHHPLSLQENNLISS